MDWTVATADAVRNTLAEVFSYIPNIIAAIIIILVGIIVAWAVKTLIVKALGYLKVKKYTDSIGLGKIFKGDVRIVELIGDIAKWIIILPFVVVALDVVKLTGVNDLIKQVLLYIPDVVKAVILIMLAFIIGDLVARVIKATATSIGVKTSEILADIARWAILIFAFFGALQHLGLAVELINILWTGIVALVVIAGGIAFGLAGQGAARDTIARIRKNFPVDKE